MGQSRAVALGRGCTTSASPGELKKIPVLRLHSRINEIIIWRTVILWISVLFKVCLVIPICRQG